MVATGNKQFLARAGVILLVMVFVWMNYSLLQSYRAFKAEHLRQSRKQVQLLANAEARALEEKLLDVAEDLKFFADELQAGAIPENRGVRGPGQGNQLLDLLYARNKGLVSAFYRVAADGIVLERRPSMPERASFDYSQKPGIAYVREHGRPGVFALTTNSGQRALSLCVPVMTSAGGGTQKLGGFLRALIYLKPLDARMAAISLEGKGHAWLEDGDQRIFAYPGGIEIGWRFEDLQQGVRGLTAKAPIVLFNQTFHLAVFVPYEDIAAPIDAFALQTAGLVGMLMLLMAVGSCLFYRIHRQRAVLEATAASGRRSPASEEQYRSLHSNLPAVEEKEKLAARLQRAEKMEASP